MKSYSRIKIFFAILFLAYLFGAFYNVSFNISVWTEQSRIITLTFGGFFVIAIASFPFIDKLCD